MATAPCSVDSSADCVQLCWKLAQCCSVRVPCNFVKGKEGTEIDTHNAKGWEAKTTRLLMICRLHRAVRTDRPSHGFQDVPADVCSFRSRRLLLVFAGEGAMHEEVGGLLP